MKVGAISRGRRTDYMKVGAISRYAIAAAALSIEQVQQNEYMSRDFSVSGERTDGRTCVLAYTRTIDIIKGELAHARPN